MGKNLIFLILFLVTKLHAEELDLFDKEDQALLPTGKDVAPSSPVEEFDDLQSLKEDVGEKLFETDGEVSKPAIEETKSLNETVDVTPKSIEMEKIKWSTIESPKNEPPAPAKKEDEKSNVVISESAKFEGGSEERDLLRISKYIQSKMPNKEWNEVATRANAERYVIQQGDWLWKISQKLFGTGFYYSKIWSMNPHIKNPHEVKPGMVLVFHTGSADEVPKVALGDFGEMPPEEAQEIANSIPSDSLGTPSDSPETEAPKSSGRASDGKMSVNGKSYTFVDADRFGDTEAPPWVDERERLVREGAFFQYGGDYSYEHLKLSSDFALTDEYQGYEPPLTEFSASNNEIPSNYDASGFDKSSIINFNFKEGFFLNTFITTNIVEDLGKIDSSASEKTLFSKHDVVYISFDSTVRVKPGDMFSVYQANGKVNYVHSDREGYRYTIIGQLRAIRKINEKWECLIADSTSFVQRGDRVTVYTPKINRIQKTFSQRTIEAMTIESYQEGAHGLSFGDVVYLDRGRSDGLELGNVLEVYSFRDRATEKRITIDPTYKIGELTVITLTDNFSTGLVTNSSSEIGIGVLAITKTSEQVAKSQKIKNADLIKDVKAKELGALDELDVELNLDNRSTDLLKKAEGTKLTDSELDELEKQEREKSIIGEHEKDLKDLEKLESDLSKAEKKLQDEKLDEDKLLEDEDLNGIEGKAKNPDKDGFESLDDIEKEIGHKYIDEDLNSKENPYGLTEFDLEEIDELLNTKSKKSK